MWSKKSGILFPSLTAVSQSLEENVAFSRYSLVDAEMEGHTGFYYVEEADEPPDREMDTASGSESGRRVGWHSVGTCAVITLSFPN